MFNLNKSLRELKQSGNSTTPLHEENKNPLPIDTRPITQAEFLEIMQRFRQDKEFLNMPMPSFAYKELDEFKDTEHARTEENYQYSKMQMEETDQDKRANNCKDRLKKKLEERKNKK